MAVQPKHTDLPPRYEATDFTNEQRHRFTKVANAAQKRRAFYKRAIEKSLVGKMKERALKPVLVPRDDKPSKIGQVIWLVTFLLVGLWAMYMYA
ncbi:MULTISPECIES: hypothetical protein [Vibrio]|uniref:Stress-associated endoplasmic reticulum protein n=1 Tax=Vibrio hyugaensis TaxID=1534743 RepID=A0ABQ5Y7D1_9VIBR|nr:MULTISPECIES: hypothetical protein [Vibrio]KIP76562.1 hypothetical protein SN10_05805 [Vibrio harveyi]UQA53075.1 hypothetical protein ITG12_25085 [Vibrio sp. ED002]GLR06892.1 hypothetical protein GCM10007906_44800 [Vibrio hyugaensis]CAH1539761.1 conserved hypothetical protein [Vibrio jasicida]